MQTTFYYISDILQNSGCGGPRIHKKYVLYNLEVAGYHQMRACFAKLNLPAICMQTPQHTTLFYYQTRSFINEQYF